MKSVGLAVLAIFELVGVGYLLLVTFLLTVWFIDDSSAFRMASSDWYRIAAVRLGAGILVAIVAGAIIFAINRAVARSIGSESSKVPVLTAVVVFVSVLVVALLGTVEFVIKKPFM